MAEKNKSTQVTINTDEATQTGAYTNLARIAHDAEAFVVDFMVVHASPPFGRLVSRVILTPGNAKRLAQALNHNIEAYERAWGPIRMPTPPPEAGTVQ